jgi:DNA-binding IclR family transcriptional regulator
VLFFVSIYVIFNLSTEKPMLLDHARGLYASELVHLSKGQLGRGTIYTLLDRMVDKGWVRELEEEPTPELQLRRTRHFITGNGQRAIHDFAQAHGLAVVTGALGGAL